MSSLCLNSLPALQQLYFIFLNHIIKCFWSLTTLLFHLYQIGVLTMKFLELEEESPLFQGVLNDMKIHFSFPWKYLHWHFLINHDG